ncbi:MAG: aldose epimerase family protein [Opitutales bacterium]
MAVLGLLPPCLSGQQATVTRQDWGEVDGQPVYLYTMTAPSGFTVKVTNYGCIVTEILVPDASGNRIDVVLGFDNLDAYLKGHPYFGCIVGRHANRIAGGTFQLDGETHQLAKNNGPNHLHGGPNGFHKHVWDSESYVDANGHTVLKLSRLSPDGEEGYPGNLQVNVSVSMPPAGIFHDRSVFSIAYEATTDQATPVNLTHHPYVNLNGAASGEPVLNHVLRLEADAYNPVDRTLIPTGIEPVDGTPFDLRDPVRLHDVLSMDHPQLRIGGGIDHNWVMRSQFMFNGAATFFSPQTGIAMRLSSTHRGFQIYSGQGLNGRYVGKGGVAYEQYDGLVLEPQAFPDSPNQQHVESYTSTFLKPGETYRESVIAEFTTGDPFNDARVP